MYSKELPGTDVGVLQNVGKQVLYVEDRGKLSTWRFPLYAQAQSQS